MPRIENVMFDLGVVLLHLEYEPALRQCVPLCDPERIAHSGSFLSLLGRTPIVDAYERGELTDREFFAQFVRHTGFRGSFGQFAAIWRSIFRENTPMVELAQRLARTYPVYLMTNASDLHVPWVFEHYPNLRFYRDYACSCYLKASKPDPLFYERALARFGVAPATCLFIDDRPDNVAAARDMGFQVVLYESPAQTIGETLNKLESA